MGLGVSSEFKSDTFGTKGECCWGCWGGEVNLGVHEDEPGPGGGGGSEPAEQEDMGPGGGRVPDLASQKYVIDRIVTRHSFARCHRLAQT